MIQLTALKSAARPFPSRGKDLRLEGMNSAGAEEPVRKLATDDNRSHTVTELSAAVARGQLTLDEFEERSTRAWAARYVDELIRLIDDVTDGPAHFPQSYQPAAFNQPAPPEQHSPTGPSQAVARVRSQITGQPQGSQLSLSIMGGAERSGNWLCPSTHASIAVMGGNVVDLREARFESGEITINTFTLMGGIDIIVPEGVQVICDGMGLMGGFGATVDQQATIRPSSLPADAPVVRVRGLAIMGGVTITTKARD